MSIPIIDINAGDTMSGMVDKINYNFTLLSLKGGGPAGIQGIQGIRGPVGPQGDNGATGANGSMILNGNPENYTQEQLADNSNNIFISNDGKIYNIMHNDTDDTYFPHEICDLHDLADSPFALGTSKSNPTINPCNQNKSYPFMLGVGAGDVGTINALVDDSANKAMMYINLDTNTSFLKMFNSGSLCGTIGLNSNNGVVGDVLTIKGDSNGIRLEGSTDHPRGVININSSGVCIPYNAEVGQLNTGYSFLMSRNGITSTSNGTNGKIDNDSNFKEKAWCLVKNGEYNSLFGFTDPGGSLKTSVGILDGTTYKGLNRIVLNKESIILFENSTNVSSDSTKIVNDAGKTSMSWSQYGVTFGGLKQSTSSNSIYCFYNQDLFSIKLSNPNSNASYGTLMTITSNGNNSIESVVSNDIASIYYDNSQIDHYNSNVANKRWRGLIYLTSGSNSQHFIKEHYSNLIVADRKTESGANKNANDTLHIHGADSNAFSGSDVVISGGNNLGGSSSVTAVGGDVYISGGSAFEEISTGNVLSDMRRLGNVVIGINPLHHKQCFNNAGYSSTSYHNNNTDTNPSTAGFFDINNIALHGNRIVIDSNANYRKLTAGYTKDDNNSASNKDMKPYVELPEDTTLQVSGVNTLNHIAPIVIQREDISSHQFMSGVMRRIIKFTNNNGSLSRSFVNPNNFNKNTINVSHQNSVFFITEQVWQKVGNIVHVNAFGRWVANKPTTPELHYISDHFFTNSIETVVENDITKIVPVLNVDDYANNEALINWLTSYDTQTNKYSYLDHSNSSGAYLPMTAFALPVVVENMCSSFCYGNGNIFTENLCSKIKNDLKVMTDVDPTESVIQSTPVTIGQYYKPNSNEYSSQTAWGSINGHNGALYTSDMNKARYSQPKNDESTNVDRLPYSFSSSAINLNDAFRHPSFVSSNGYWGEANYRQTEMMDEQNWCYIYPEMMTTYGNETLSSSGCRVRPCVGLYTWITLNYSYSVMDGFYNKIPKMTNSSGVTPNNDDFSSLTSTTWSNSGQVYTNVNQNDSAQQQDIDNDQFSVN